MTLAPDWLCEVLSPSTARLFHQMQLIDVAETGRDQQLTLGRPAERSCLPRVQICVQFIDEIRRRFGNVVEGHIAALDPRQRV